jgi:putative NADPH-quinone reductase
MTRIALIDGHPDPRRGRFVNALADAYAAGAKRGGHELRRINLSELKIELLRSAEAWTKPAPVDFKKAQNAILWAEHLVFIYPLWLGGMPALLKAFLEQASAGGFFVEPAEKGRAWTQKLKGKSAHVIVTMGMPAALYRYWFGAASLKALERNILAFAGVKPIRDTLIGMVEGKTRAARERLIGRIEGYGAAAR